MEVSIKAEVNKIIVHDLLTRIINKGGLMAYAAKMYLNDEQKTHQFIHDCFKQCHNERAIQYWGEDLVFDIKKYCNDP